MVYHLRLPSLPKNAAKQPSSLLLVFYAHGYSPNALRQEGTTIPYVVSHPQVTAYKFTSIRYVTDHSYRLLYSYHYFPLELGNKDFATNSLLSH